MSPLPSRREVGIGRPVSELPLALADLHLSLSTNDRVACWLKPLPGPEWTPGRATDLVIGAGFTPAGSAIVEHADVILDMIRIHSLPDIVAAQMRLLIVGLNPSPYSADHSIGYARPGNRFWPAALAAGIVSADRNPRHALQHHGLGMTDLVRRTTQRADELDRAEFVSGFERVERLTAWLKPQAVCFVGLGGWRAVVDRKASSGVQDRTLGDRPVYVMPHTSGLNAHCRLEDLVAHFRAAAELADRA